MSTNEGEQNECLGSGFAELSIKIRIRKYMLYTDLESSGKTNFSKNVSKGFQKDLPPSGMLRTNNYLIFISPVSGVLMYIINQRERGGGYL